MLIFVVICKTRDKLFDAVVNYQLTKNLSVTGYVDVSTKEMLLKECIAENTEKIRKEVEIKTAQQKALTRDDYVLGLYSTMDTIEELGNLKISLFKNVWFWPITLSKDNAVTLDSINQCLIQLKHFALINPAFNQDEDLMKLSSFLTDDYNNMTVKQQYYGAMTDAKMANGIKSKLKYRYKVAYDEAKRLENQEALKEGAELLSLAIDTTGVPGFLKAVYQKIDNKDLITGREISEDEQNIQLALSALPFVGKGFSTLKGAVKGTVSEISVAYRLSISIAKVEKVLGRCHVYIFTKASEVTDKLQKTLKYSVDELGYLVKKITKIENDAVYVELVGGVKYTIKEADVANDMRPAFRDSIKDIWKQSGGSEDVFKNSKSWLYIEDETIKTVNKIRVGQWMSKAEYEQFVKTGEIPRTNVLTKGKEGYIKQANSGDYYVEFDVDSSLLVTKDEELGWSLVKSKNDMYLKLAEKKGKTLPAPIGENIIHITTK